MRVSRGSVLLIGTLLTLLIGTISGVRAQEPTAPKSAPIDSGVPQTVFETTGASPSGKTQTHVAVFLLGTSPTDESLKVGGGSVTGAGLERSFGGGIKVGAFPSFGGGVFGLEGELFGFGGDFKAPTTEFARADGSLVVLNSMINLLLRYPGSVLQPYIGVGGGISLGSIEVDTLQSGPVTVTGKSGDGTLAYQLLGGLRAYVSDKVYLFGEYKYFGANYRWQSEEGLGGNPKVSLSVRTHIIAAGLGISF